MTRRTRRIWFALSGTLLGTVTLFGIALQVGFARNTDRRTSEGSVTADFRGTGASAPPIVFRDVAAEAGVVMRHGPGPRTRSLPEDTGSGVAWGDVDGDGDWDLYLVNLPGPGEEASNRLFRNDGGRFTDITRSAGVGDPRGFGMGASFADYDADGDVDLYVTNRGPNRLFRNRGDGTFEEVGEAAGVADPLWSTGAAWGDFDRDGFLDLYVCNYVTYDADRTGPEPAPRGSAGGVAVPFTLNPNSFDPQPNRLFRNRGDHTYEEVAGSWGVADPEGRSFAAVACDLDGDGWLDLYVNNDVSTNRLFRNLGAGRPAGSARRFADRSALTGTADPRGSMGLSAGEIGASIGEPDGLPDLFLTHWVAQENALYVSKHHRGRVLEYWDETRRLRLGESSLARVGWGCALIDLDLDGRLDIAVANGSTLESREDPSRLRPEPMLLHWSDGERFHDVAPRAGYALRRPHNARGMAAADFDGDGDLDLAVHVNRGAPLLLRNDTETGHRSLAVRLEGPPATCFGARVEVVAASRTQVLWRGADATFLGNHAAEMIFGLGEAGGADEVSVRWADGKETTLGPVPAGRVDVAHPGPG